MILSIFVFNALFGIIGMLIAVPTTAVILMFVKDFYLTLKLENPDNKG
jgi:predicted PurR-regulated permease PerM